MTLFIAMTIFVFSMSASPGMVNIIILSSGLNHGFKKTLPFVSGASFGFIGLFLLVSLGLNQMELQNLLIIRIFGLCGAAYLLYLGFKMASSNQDLKTKQQNRPTFMQAVWLQWLNPKAWGASLAAVSAFGLIGSTQLTLAFAALYFVACYASLTLWAFVGHKLSHILQSASHMRIFNLTMGTSLIIIAVYLGYQLSFN